MKYLKISLIIIGVFVQMTCISQRKVALDPASEDFYEKARLIMTKQEEDIFNHLPDQSSREEFIRDFWAKRDVNPETEENEFKEEFFSRIEYANLRFREGIPGWKTDRGRIYIYLGPPDKVEERPFINNPEIKGLLWWGYYEHKLGIEFVDTTGDGSYTINQHMSEYGNLLQVIKRAKFGQIFSKDAARYMDFDARFDSKRKEIVVSIPVASLEFKDEGGLLKAEFDFEFFVYKKKGSKMDRFTQIRSVEQTEDELLKLDEINFTFPYNFKPGKYYVDVIIILKPDRAKARKIFEIKV